MTLVSFGDAALQGQLLRANAELRLRLATLGQELSSGRVADLPRHLGGAAEAHVANGLRLSRTEALLGSAREVAGLASAKSVALATVEAARAAGLSPLMLSLEGFGPGDVGRASAAARESFELAVSALQARHGTTSLFSGDATDGPSLRPAGEILDAILARTAGLVTVASIAAAVEDYFAPGGEFETDAYLGSGADLVRRIDEGAPAVIGARADDPALREVLRGLALSVVAGTTDPAPDLTARRGLLGLAREALIGSEGALTDLRATLGRIEGRIEEATVRLSAETAALSILTGEQAAADPYRTATLLAAVQTQLQTHYEVTARLSRLSLAQVLR